LTGEQFLNSIRYLDNEINALDYERVKVMDQRQALLDAAQTWGGLTGVCVQHMPGSKTESIGVVLASLRTPEEVAAKINAYQERINKKIDRLISKKHTVLNIIEKMQNTAHKALILYRYVNCLQWATIADLMGYEQSYVRDDLKIQAVHEFESYWKLPTKTDISLTKPVV
jgi:hypothetical protein